MTSGSVADALARLLETMPDPVGASQAEAFEAELAARFGTRHAVAVASGTAALHCAMVSCGIGPGTEVLVPAVSVVMSVAPVVYAGATPVFIDCDPTGTDVDYDALTAAVSSRTRAVLAVPLWGRAGDPRRLAAFAADHGLRVIEDACQAHGTLLAGQPLGTFGDIGCFSLRDGKILSSGEGGFLLTDDDQLAAYARAYRTHWQTPPPGEPPLARLGHNYRLAEPLALIARANLARFDDLLAHRRDQTALLTSLVGDTPGISVPASRPEESWNGYAPLTRLSLPRPRAFSEHLAACGVPNSVGTFRLVSCDQRPPFAPYSPTRCPTATRLIDATLAIAITSKDTDDRIRRYAQTITTEARRWAHL
jgi:perosamine synthetase